MQVVGGSLQHMLDVSPSSSLGTGNGCGMTISIAFVVHVTAVVVVF